jgi:GH25 family lysozyme M1 (1,4-beta-N-acetylmuramidase)
VNITPNILDLYHADNAEKMPPFADLQASGIWGVIHKATQGDKIRDMRFAERAKAALAVPGFLFGAYHFLDSSDPEKQADLFLDAIGPFISDNDNLLLAADYEKSAYTPALHQLLAFMQHVEAGAPGHSVVIYSGDLIRETLTPLKGGKQDAPMAAAEVYFSQHRLWLAEYGPHERIPWPWDATPELCCLWQFRDNGRYRNVLGNLDFNFYSGSRENAALTWKAGVPAARKRKGE